VQECKVPDDPDGVANYLLNLETELPDCAIIPYDRAPMAMVAFIAYHRGIPIAQLHAGDISSGTLDDMDRWCITAWADYHFCAGKDQATRVRRFLKLIGKEKKDVKVYVSGVTNLDELDKMSEPPDGEYDVVMYNPPTKAMSKLNDELRDIVNLIDKSTYWLEPNGDDGSSGIEHRVLSYAKAKPEILWTKSMEHPALLGLLSRAKRVIGNSSALYFEAPHFGCKVIHVGERNRIRENVELRPGGSKRIAKRLKTWLER